MMKSYLRMGLLLALAGGFLWAAYLCGRNWLVYATIYGGTAGHTRLDSNLSSISHLETQWYWAMVIFAVLSLGCLALALLQLLRRVRGGTAGEAE